MSEHTSHPTREELSAYSLGQLPEDRAVAIDSHISHCEPCCETIVELSSEDTFAGLLREAANVPAEQTGDSDFPSEAISTSRDNTPAELAGHPKYEIVGLIGKGGMGDVYEAIHRKMERKVALKVVNRDLFRKTEAVNRFHREVKTAAQLSHPNIVASHDADQAGDYHFLVMEFVDGVDLAEIVRERGPLPVAEACDFIRQAALGLQHAHELGMVHRDIKPHNLMVTADGTVKILDFGLASLAPAADLTSDFAEVHSDLTAAGAIMGTPDFISPEQAHDARRVDIRSDIYSLGATFYYLLSGRAPFCEGSVMHKLKSHEQDDPAPLNSVRDDVPKELAAIVSKMMAKDPAERYLTPSEVAKALEAFLQNWRPGDESPQPADAVHGGNDSHDGGQKYTAGDSNPSRLPIVAKLLLYTSLLFPCLLILLQFLPLDISSGETDWFMASMIASIVLSTISGIVAGVQQIRSTNRDDRRVNGMTTDQTVLIILILAISAVMLLNHSNDKAAHIEVTPKSDTMSLGSHPVSIVDTSGKKPLGGTTSTHQDDASGITIHSFKSANGRYDITLADKVLTVNGERYTLENPTDVIRIVDDRVEITQVRELRVGSVARDAISHKAGQQRSDNQLKMPLCWCPAGDFKMGREQLPVTLTRGFWMGKYEVTQVQFEALIGDNPSENKGESLPVEKVAWNDAKKFCQKFTELERKAGRLPKGCEYRLPTEAQWEYACRADMPLVWDDEKDLVYSSKFGNDLSELGDYAWYSENSDGMPHAVGQKKPNAWGLCDMYGNVCEWVRDAWQSKLSGGKDPEVDVWSPVHTCRGSDWLSPAEPCGSPFYRGIGVAGREAHLMGFRVALVQVGESGGGVITSQPSGELQSKSLELLSAGLGAGTNPYERLYQIRILLLVRSMTILDSIVDEETADKAAESWPDLFPLQVEAEYLESRLVEFSELEDSRAEAREKYGLHVDELRQKLRERQAECQKLPFFQKVNRAQQKYSDDLLSVVPFETRNGHAWRADGPQFVIWFPPSVIPEIDLSSEKGTLEVLVVDEETGVLHPQREHVQCGGKAVLPLQDDKHGCLYWLRTI